jgi:hypothetical protein
VTPRARQVAGAQVVLADRQKAFCYDLGPTLLTGANVGSADADLNPTSSTWEVNVHFPNDGFVTNVASVEVGKQIAIIVDGVVQSTPVIQSGVDGHDVTISGPFDEAQARDLAARIDPSSRSRPPVTPTTTVTDALLQTFSTRCHDVAPRLGVNPSMMGVQMPTADMVRSGFLRAHQSVPPEVANLDGTQRIALCSFTTTGPNGTPPTTTCPNGDPAMVGAAPEVLFVVDAHLAAATFPGIQYLVPPGMTASPTPNPCAGHGSP